jgi:hypothetical protein
MPDLDPAPVFGALASDPRLRVYLRNGRINPVRGFLPDQAWPR